MRFWLLFTIICVAILLVGVLIDWRAKRKKQTLLIDKDKNHSIDEGYDPRNRDDPM
ncbi:MULTISPECIES: hypothetical protein [Brevibacillus]|jgi:hypothetical protein|uniref:Uncharacterized protein n=1 Tax=Brevibacillus parabrevis TaxID=54914 RepID=A0A4Y3PKK4_BREPA|nr:MULTISPECIES: hypothetical protein [Brevibacillus]MBU8715965.1 hypothetical protein [Brevibacillus parabrevis]MDH6353107.1 hypothetical protein [Brevibacillus sp. 1238]MDR5002685.1 hypothetical protein [Brevibacillus parabrevis]MED1723822.1 hypothetical protein [Brevibacillus parabrevis]MED2256995.1 hypothetical protein [Brevibacillus parabrevis]